MKSRVLILLIWLGLFFFSLSRHQPWRDEYQSWLVSTRTASLSEFVDAVRHERHPPLHYALQRSLSYLWPKSNSWPTQAAVDAVTVPFTIASVVLLLFFLDLPLAQAGFLSFGIYIFREYGIISRCYPIGVFFLLLALILRRRGRQNLLMLSLLLAASTHLLITLVAGTFFLLEAYDTKLWRRPLAGFAALGFAGLVLFQAPPADSSFNRPPDLSIHVLSKFLHYLNQSFWPIENYFKPFVWNSIAASTDLMTLLLLPATLFWLKSRYDLKRIMILLSGPLVILCVFADAFTRHLGVGFMAVLAGCLLYPHPSKSKFSRWPDPLTAFALVGFLSTVVWWVKWAPYREKTSFDFSGARELIRSVPRLSSPESIVLSGSDAVFFTWMAETKASVYDIQRDAILRYPYFIKLPSSDRKTSEIWSEWCSDKLNDFQNSHPDQTIFIGLALEETPAPECGPADLVFKSSRASLTNEDFAIYLLPTRLPTRLPSPIK